MPNEFKIKNGLVVDSGGAQVTGSLEVIVNSNVELQVLSTGVRLGNAITDSHVMTGTSRMTGSLILSGSINARQTGFNASGVFTGDTLGSIALTTDTSNGFSVFTLGGALQIYDNTNAATRFTLSSAGNISVNAITASGMISIGRTTTSQAVIQRAQAPAGAYSTILAAGTGIVDTFPYTMADGHGATIDMRGGDPTSDQYVGGIIFSANGNTSPLGDGNAIVFKTRTGTNTYTERMRITHDGNVGIGVSTPTTKFHVDGTVRIDNQGGSTVNIVGSSTPNNYYGGGSSGGADYLSDPAVWLKINLDGTEYYFPGY
jgi:hypothetical protein